MSNFNFLHPDWPEFIGDAKAVERLVHVDARGTCIRARYLAEQVVLWMYENDEDLTLPYDTAMGNLIHEQPFKKIVGYQVFNKINAIRKIGNIAAHDRKTISERDALMACREAFHLMYWLWSTYSDGEVRPDMEFDPALVPAGQAEPPITAEELEALQQEIEAKTKAIKEIQRQLKEKDEALEQRNREIKQMRLQSKRFADNHDYNEAETRQFLIDVLLREAGWDPAEPNVREYEVEGMPESTNPSGKGYVDYVLWGDDGKPLALVEAKRTTRSYEEGQHQAKLYAGCLEQEFGVRPVIFLSNGYEIWIWDDARYPIRPIMGFYDKASLQKLFFQKANRKKLHLVEVNKDITERYYQIEAIRRVGERFEQGHREALLVMATGTGKTRTSISVTDVLLRYNWAKRVLFLADRNALVKQAYNAYAEHLPEVPIVNLVEEKNDTAARVVFSTYPTMLNQIERLKDGRRVFDVGHFDLVIIDEAHRSVYNKYGAIFEYFDSLLLGLTATPKGEVDRNTYELFSHEPGNPTSFYELDKAVKDRFLVPPRKLSVTGKFLTEGITYDDLSPEEQAEYDDLFTDDETGLVPGHIDANQLNSWLFNENTVEQVLKQLMSDGIKVEGGDRLGKTIIFAKNHKHAVFIQEVFDKNFPQYGGHFARMIHNKVDHAQDLIDSFCSPGKGPVIAISVDMMDTGIDAPDVVNLVFFKPVRSKTKFHQMIGRGTRLRKDLFGPGQHKREFLIFDYCGNFEFFNENPDGYEPTASPSVGKRLFKGKLSLAAKLRNEPYKKDEALQEFRRKILDQLHQAVENLEEQSVMVRPHLKLKHRLADRSVWEHLESHERREIVNDLGEVVQIAFGDDENARRFDLLILTLQHQLLDGELEEKKTREIVIGMGEQLYSKRHIPAVKKVKSTVEEVIRDEFWADTSLPALEKVRVDLRDLIRLIDFKERKPVYSNFTDEFGEAVEVESGVKEKSIIDPERYERSVKAFIEANKHHLIIEKIRKARPLTDKDIQTLEEFLFEADPVVSREQFYEVLGEGLNLIQFIRSVAGLSKEAVIEVFGEFLQDKRLSSTQIQFIRQMINFYTKKGRLTIENLYEPPFDFIHEGGIDGVFEDKNNVMELIIEKVERLNEVG